MAFYAQYDYIDKYVEELAKEVKKNIDYLIMGVNGVLSCETIKKFSKYMDKFIFRENDGYDIEGYRQEFNRQLCSTTRI